MAGGDGTIMILGFHCRRSILLTFTDFMAVANGAFQRSPRFWKKPDQYRACLQLACAPGSDGFGFKLIRKRDEPSLYFDVTGHKCKLAALLDSMAIL
jgi:hypothetical protein